MKRLHIIFSIILVLFVAAPYSYASTMSMKGGQISMELPAGWDVITSERFSDAAGEFFNVTKNEAADYEDITGKVFLGVKTFKNGGDSYHSSVEIGYNSYTNEAESYDEYTTEDLESFYYDEGETIIGTVFNNEESPEPIGEPKVVNGTWGPFIEIGLTDPDSEDGKDGRRLYYTVKSGVLVSFVLTSGGNPMAEEINDVETMVKSYEDTDYYYTYMGLSEDEEDTNYNDDDGSGWIAIIAIMTVIAAGIFAFIKNSEEQGKNAAGTTRPRSENQGTAAKRPQERPVMAEEKTLKKILPKFQPIKADGKTVAMRSDSGPRKAKTSEESYAASLKTLLDSGLLTKEEYRDMLDKHARHR